MPWRAFDWKQALRLAAVILVGVIVQIAAVSQLSFFGAQPDLAPLITVDIGLLMGAETGVICGFFVGLLLDLALLQTLGVSSLVLLGLGYVAGRQRELRDVTAPSVSIVAGALATLIWTSGFAFIQFLLGVDAPVSGRVFWEILGTTVINGAIALPLFLLLRRVLAAGLEPDVLPARMAPRRRRPGYGVETGRFDRPAGRS